MKLRTIKLPTTAGHWWVKISGFWTVVYVNDPTGDGLEVADGCGGPVARFACDEWGPRAYAPDESWYAPTLELIRTMTARWRWTTVRDTGITRYQVNGRGERRVSQRPGGYQPIDRHWLATGEWARHGIPSHGRSPV